ncbi:MAG: hypothetical protein PHX30_00030 [Candidatus Pacebacteria bacterium]|nr:hypothetical protein [Candidatus Paceibacterota bacterium]
MTLEIKIQIKGAQAGLSLCDLDSGGELDKMEWEDKRDLSDKLFLKMDAMLCKQKIPLERVQKISFSCDSPYFARKEKWQELHLENIDGTGKCGFTAWQTGEIISKVMSFALEK